MSAGANRTHHRHPTDGFLPIYTPSTLPPRRKTGRSYHPVPVSEARRRAMCAHARPLCVGGCYLTKISRKTRFSFRFSHVEHLFMDGARTRTAVLRADGGDKRTLREATKGSPDKPEPSRTRRNQPELVPPLGLSAEAGAAELHNNSRCAAPHRIVRFFRAALRFEHLRPC